MLAFGAILLILLWRTHVLKSTRPTPHSGSARTEVSDSAGRAERDLAWDEQQGGHALARHVGRSASALALRLDRAVAAADADDLLAAVLLGVAHLVHHLGQLLPGDVQLPRRAAPPDGQTERV